MAVAGNGIASAADEGAQRLTLWADWLSPALLLCAPFVYFLRLHGYGVLHPEVLTLFAVWLSLAFAASVLLRTGGERTRVLVYALLVTAVLNVRGVHGFVPWLVGLLAIGWVLRAHLATVVGAVAAMLMASTLLLPVPPPPAAGNFERPVNVDPSLPPIIHLVLDEHLGVGAIPRDVRNGPAVARQLRDLYQRYGFHLAGGAYSQYFKTFDSLSNLLNFTSTETNLHYFPNGKETDSYVLRDNAYFALLGERGYTVRVYQSSYLDYCLAPEVSGCFNYPKNSIASVEGRALPWPQKALFILNSYLRAASAERQARRNYRDLRDWLQKRGWELPLWRASYRAGPLAITQTWDRLRRDLLRSPDGTVFFAHLLSPHTPYALQADCAIRPQVSEWLGRNSGAYRLPRQNSAATRAYRYGFYLQQVSCLAQQLRSLFESLRQAGLLERATIIVHGDHGSRIAQFDPRAEQVEVLSDRDLVDHFSTLFAIRAPGVAPGYDPEPAPLQNLLARALGRAPVTEAGHVYLLRETHAPLQRRALGDFATAHAPEARAQ